MNAIDNFSDYKVIAHISSWCPDCTREMNKLQAFITDLGNKAPALELIKKYENKEDYKKLKANHQLPINALPTIYFYNNKKELVSSIIEKSDKPIINYVLGIK